MVFLRRKSIYTIFLFFCLLTGSFLYRSAAQGYGTHTTHPALTDQMVDFYNLSFSDQLTPEEKEALVQGSIDEDIPPRYANHFYDPVYNQGWEAQNLGIIPPTVLKLFTRIFINVNTTILSSKQWAHDEAVQARYVGYGGNHSWEQALRQYAQGDTIGAYYSLGHILHLIEDATVPDHTRNDTHVHPFSEVTLDGGSPYEDYSKQFTRGRLNVIADLQQGNKQPVILDSLDAYFDAVAGFSHRYFFSEHTINTAKYKYPKIFKELGLYGYGKDHNGATFPLVKIDKTINLKTGGITTKLSLKDESSFVLENYFSRLSESAVTNGAGIIHLFKQEAEAAKKDISLLPAEPTASWWQKVRSPAFAVFLPVSQAASTLSNAVGGALSALKNGFSAVVSQGYDSLLSKLGFFTPALTAPVDQLAPALQSSSPAAPTTFSQTVTPAVAAAPLSATKPLVATAPSKPTAPPAIKSPSLSKPTIPSGQNKSVPTAGPGGVTNTSGSSSSANILNQNSTSNAVLSVSSSTSLSPVVDTASTTDSIPESSVVFPGLPPPMLDASFLSTIFTTSSSFVITGAVTTTTVKVFFFSSATSTYDSAGNNFVIPSSGVWSIETELAEGGNTFYFIAVNSLGVTSTLSQAVVLIRDNTRPTVPEITINNKSGPTSTDLEIEFLSSDALSSRVDYDVEYATAPSSTDWLPLITNTASTSIIFAGERGRRYFFRARALDSAGNTSEFSVDAAANLGVVIALSQELVFNEVAWAGTSADYPNDEWFELFNNTSTTIDLRGWKILVNGIQIDFEQIQSTVIQPGGYFLLERDRDTAVRNIDAEIIYHLSGGFPDQGAKLELISPEEKTVDVVDASAGWYAGSLGERRSMERISTMSSGSEAANWQTNQGARLAGRSFNGAPVLGSPRQTNFGFIVLQGTQEQPLTLLTKENNPYVLIDYQVPEGFTLRIEKGVVIKSFAPEAVLNIHGTVEAVGTRAEPIIFTSGRDQDLADNRASAVVGLGWGSTSPASQDWQGMWFHPGSIGVLEEVAYRYAGHPFRPNNFIFTPFISQAIRVEQAELVVSGVEFFANGGTTVFADHAQLTIVDTVFANNAGEATLAVDADYSSTTLKRVTARGFTNPTGALAVRHLWPEFQDLIFEDNTRNSIFIDRADISGTVRLNKDTSVVFSNPTVLPGAKLIIDPGVRLALPQQSSIMVQGELEALGTAEEPIIITSEKIITTSDYWGNLVFDHATGTFRHVVISRGNRSELEDGTIVAINSAITLEDSSITDPRPPGNIIKAKDSIVALRRSVLSYPIRPDFFALSAGVWMDGGKLTIESTTFQNIDVGIIGLSFPLPALELIDMGLGNFPGVQEPINPLPWLGTLQLQ